MQNTTPWFQVQHTPAVLAFGQCVISTTPIADYQTVAPTGQWTANIGETEASFRGRVAADVVTGNLGYQMLYQYNDPAYFVQYWARAA
jgi:hypothetical protein